jgi:hypothetical protein
MPSRQYGKDLPTWPVYNVENPTVMYLKVYPKAEPFPNLDKLKGIDGYYKWKRSLVEESK